MPSKDELLQAMARGGDCICEGPDQAMPCKLDCPWAYDTFVKQERARIAMIQAGEIKL